MGCLYFTPCAHCSAKCVNSGLNRFEVFFLGGEVSPWKKKLVWIVLGEHFLKFSCYNFLRCRMSLWLQANDSISSDPGSIFV